MGSFRATSLLNRRRLSAFTCLFLSAAPLAAARLYLRLRAFIYQRSRHPPYLSGFGRPELIKKLPFERRFIPLHHFCHTVIVSLLSLPSFLSRDGCHANSDFPPLRRRCLVRQRVMDLISHSGRPRLFMLTLTNTKSPPTG